MDTLTKLQSSAKKMRTLGITNSKPWFDLIRSGQKKREYREIKAYWTKRLFHSDEKDFDFFPFENDLKKGMELEKAMELHAVKPTYFALVKSRNGYHPSNPTITWTHKGVSVGIPNPKWCEPEDIGKLLYVLEIGDLIP